MNYRPNRLLPIRFLIMTVVVLIGIGLASSCDIFTYTEFNPDSREVVDFFDGAVRASFGESARQVTWSNVIDGYEGNWAEADAEAGTIHLYARNADNNAGKIANSLDGITYFFRQVPADRNFRLSADVEVVTFGGYDQTVPENERVITSNGQEGFGLMARDWVPFYPPFSMQELAARMHESDPDHDEYRIADLAPPGRGNMVFAGANKRGVRYGYRADVTGDSETITNPAVESDGSSSRFQYFPAELADYSEYARMVDRPDFPLIGGTYRCTLEKSNSGFRITITPPAEKGVYMEDFIWEPDILTSIDQDYFYVGFFTARAAEIKVSNINYSESDSAQDAMRIEPDPLVIVPDFSIDSPSTYASLDGKFFRLRASASVPGYISVKQNGETIAEFEEAQWLLSGGSNVTRPAVFDIPANTLIKGENVFQVVFHPIGTYPTEDNLLIANTEPIRKTVLVDRRWFGTTNTPLYVGPNGRSTNSGTVGSPLDIDTAIAYVLPGQTIIMEDGIYNILSFNIPKYNDGRQGAVKRIEAETRGQVIIDFDKNINARGAVIEGNRWELSGIDFRNTPDKVKGLVVMGNNNLVEWVNTYNNGDTGLQISGRSTEPSSWWPSNNTVRYSTSYNNMDAAQIDADGFAAKLTVGEGNRFEWCISHNNADDGWDLYSKVETGTIGVVTIENSISYRNGILMNSVLSRAGRNGFKLGGESMPIPHVVRNSIAFQNGANGFTSNSNPSIVLENVTAFNNGYRPAGTDPVNVPNIAIYSSAVIDAEVSGILSLFTETWGTNRTDNVTLAIPASGFAWSNGASRNADSNRPALTIDSVISSDPPLYNETQTSLISSGEGFVRFIESAGTEGGWSFDLGDFLVLKDGVTGTLSVGASF